MTEEIAFWCAVIGAGCWPRCFWWMYRIATRQEALLSAIKKQAKRIEQLSREEHDLIRDVQPKVEEIREEVTDKN